MPNAYVIEGKGIRLRPVLYSHDPILLEPCPDIVNDFFWAESLMKVVMRSDSYMEVAAFQDVYRCNCGGHIAWSRHPGRAMCEAAVLAARAGVIKAEEVA